MAALVECRSDTEYPERPVAIFLHGERFEIDCILSRWRTPEGKWFRVNIKNGDIHELFYDESLDEWIIQT
jgi:hypothetical protein